MIIIIISLVVAMCYAFFFHRKHIIPVLYSFLVFIVVDSLLYKLDVSLKSLNEHKKIHYISIALCGEKSDLKIVQCAPEYYTNGVAVSILSSKKSDEMSVLEINKIIQRAKEIKPLITDKTLRLNFSTQVIRSESRNKLKGTKNIFYTYNVYKSVDL